MRKLLEVIKERRKKLGFTQNAMGEKLSMPQSHYSKIESGSSDPRVSSFLDICRALELEILIVPKESKIIFDSIAVQDKENKPAWQPDEEDEP